MERQEIVKIFLDKGLMIDNASLDYFQQNQTMLQPFLDYYSDAKNKTGTVTFNIVQELLKIKTSGLQILKTDKKLKKASVADQASFLNKRYEAIRKIMNGRLDLLNLVSISKISQKNKKFSLLGIVKQKNDETKSIVLEDTTGEAEISFSENFIPDYDSILHDDILGMMCSNELGRYYYIKTVWPDISLAREVKKTKESTKCMFISITDDSNFVQLHDWFEKSADEPMTLFLFSHEGTFAKKFFSLLPKKVEKFHVCGTSVVSLSNILFFLSNNSLFRKYQDFFHTTSEGTLVNLVKRRNMNPCMDIDKSVYENDPFILDEIPDVVAISSFEEQSATSYKGINMLLLDNFSTNKSFLLLDMKTREVIKIEIS